MASTCINYWLQERLGFDIDLNPETVGDELFDGRIYFKLLQSYNYGNECKKILKAKNSLAAFQNLKELCIWFKLIGLSYNEKQLLKIANKDGMHSLKLLYELYAALESIDRPDIFNLAREIPSTERDKNLIPILDLKTPKQQLQQVDSCTKLSLDEKLELASIFKEQQEKIRQCCILKSIKRRNLAKSQKMNIMINEHPDSKSEDEIVEMRDSPKMKLETKKGLVTCSPREYTNLLKIWRRKSLLREIRNRKTQSQLLNATWHHLIKSQTEQFYTDFANKLLKQSAFEKYLVQRLNRIHSSYYTFLEHSQIIKENLQNKLLDENDFEKTYKILHEMKDEDYEEKKRVFELHMRLYFEKKIRKRKKTIEMCQDIVKDIIIFAINCVTFRQKYEQCVPRKLIIEWKEMFYKGIPNRYYKEKSDLSFFPEEIVEDVNEEELIPEMENEYCTGDKEDSIVLDQEYNEFLDDLHLHNYLYLTGPWFIEHLLPLSPDYEEPDLQITGFVMHRLLEAKHPFPDKEEHSDVTNHDVKMIVTPFNESQAKSKLKHMLQNTKIVVLDSKLVTNFCMEIYKQEKSKSNVGDSLRKESDDFFLNIAKPNVKIKKGSKSKPDTRNETKSKKQKKKKLKTGTGTTKGKSMEKEDEKKDKSIQVPSVVEVKTSLKHSRAGLLGRLVFEDLHAGREVSDIHFINMLKEYINSLVDKKGWVLINYPFSYRQVALLEYVLGGHLVPIPIRSLTGETIITAQHYLNINLLEAFEKKLESLNNKAMGKVDQEEMAGEEVSKEEEQEEDIFDYSTVFAAGAATETIEQIKEQRTSKILPRPNKPEQFIRHKTFLTKYINLVNTKSAKNRRASTTSVHGHLFRKVVDPFVYYKHIGAGETFTYEKSISISLLKKIVKLILKKDEVKKEIEAPKVISVMESASPNLVKRLKKVSQSIRGVAADDASCINILEDMKFIKERKSQIVNIDYEENLVDIKKSLIVDIDGEQFNKTRMHVSFTDKDEVEKFETSPAPGDKDWDYSELPLTLPFLVSLASIWESAESIYLSNLKRLFYYYRKLDSKVLPYKFFIRKVYNDCVHAKDEKQKIITDFQYRFNSVKDELRNKTTMQNELNFKINELFNFLCELCDQRKKTAENVRFELVRDNWLARQSFAIINLCINLMQIEMDRFVDTLQILYDYHMSSLQKLPEEIKFEKVIIPKVKFPDIESPMYIKKSLELHKKKMKKMDALSGKVVSDIKQIIFGNTVDVEVNPAVELLSEVVNEVTTLVYNVNNHFSNIVREEYLTIYNQQLFLENEEEIEDFSEEEKLPEPAETMHPEKKKPKKGKKNKESKQKEEVEEKVEKKEDDDIKKDKKGKKKDKKKKTKSAKTEETETKIEEPSESKEELFEEGETKNEDVIIDFTTNLIGEPYNNLLWEWSKAVELETKRILMRLKLIEARISLDLNELLFLIKDAFYEFSKEIVTKYHTEIKNIYLATNLLKAATEDCKPLEPMIILDRDKFFVYYQSGEEQKINCPPPPTPLIEASQRFVFTLEKLNKIMNKLKLAAPDGKMLVDSFVTILDDMVLFDSERGQCYLPIGWLFLESDDVKYIVSSIFRESLIIDWRDFLILGLNLTFPTIEQLLNARNQFIHFDSEGYETITWEAFEQIDLWFETNLTESLETEIRLVLVKEFLFNLFKVNENEMNYAAMLLAFCKGEEDPDGLVKAFSLLAGKHYITTKHQLHRCADENDLDVPIIVEYILYEILCNVVNLKEGVVITELDRDDTDNENFTLSSDQSDGSDKKVKFPFHKKSKQKKQKNKLDRKTEQLEEWMDSTNVDDTFYVSLVPYDMVLSLFIYFLNYYSFSSPAFYSSIELADNLKKLYLHKGKWNLIRVFDLIDSDLVKDLFKRIGCFKSVDVALLVETLYSSKGSLSTTLTDQQGGLLYLELGRLQGLSPKEITTGSPSDSGRMMKVTIYLLAQVSYACYHTQ